MLWYVILGIIAIILFLTAILLIRGALFRPYKETQSEVEDLALDTVRIVENMVAMVKCATISNRDAILVDRSEFIKFERLLQERYPIIHSKSSLVKIGETGLLYIIKGRSSESPSVCMSHYDVVPAEEEQWSKPAFEGIIENDMIWGRGTLDTKATLLGIMEALEYLLESGYVPNNDLYLSFSGDEEIDGESCPDIVRYLEINGIIPAFVLDEGGAVVEKVLPNVDRECALIGIGEKGGVNINFSMDSSGGHSSTPLRHTVLGRLSKAIVNIENSPFRSELTIPVAKMFDIIGRHSTFGYRVIFANLWFFLPILDAMSKRSGGELNAMLRTTIAVTKMEGSKAYNVLPPKACFGINMRLLGEDTIDKAIERLKRIVNDDSINIELVNGMNPSIYSDIDCVAWDILSKTISKVWPSAIVSPYLMMACSDSRHYCRITDKVYRFSAMRLSKEERRTIHGNDEKIPIPTLIKTVEFYVRLFEEL